MGIETISFSLESDRPFPWTVVFAQRIGLMQTPPIARQRVLLFEKFSALESREPSVQPVAAVSTVKIVNGEVTRVPYCPISINRFG